CIQLICHFGESVDRAMLNFDFKFITCIMLSSFVLVTIAAVPIIFQFQVLLTTLAAPELNYKILSHNQRLTNIHW
ncbi:MAG: hypothetical protein WB511_03445, partial [Nitrososphaeraceae archaeon]